MVNQPLIIVGLLAACLSGVHAQQNQTPDRDFIVKVAESGPKEIELAKLAKQKGAAPSVKALAERLERDHQKLDQEVKALAQSKSIALAAPDPKAAAEHKAEVTKLEAMDGSVFDRAYSTMMVQAHTTSIASFEQASKSKDPDVKAFAEKTLPTLHEHLKMAKEAAGTATPKATSGTKPQY